MEVKQAMRDHRFRDSLPVGMKDDVVKYLQNPNCGGCNITIFRRILKEASEKLKEYYPGREIATEEVPLLQENNWLVINCNANNLEQELRKLHPGRKQVSIARYEDQVTVVVNELD